MNVFNPDEVGGVVDEFERVGFVELVPTVVGAWFVVDADDVEPSALISLGRSASTAVQIEHDWSGHNLILQYGQAWRVLHVIIVQVDGRLKRTDEFIQPLCPDETSLRMGSRLGPGDQHRTERFDQRHHLSLVEFGKLVFLRLSQSSSTFPYLAWSIGRLGLVRLARRSVDVGSVSVLR